MSAATAATHPLVRSRPVRSAAWSALAAVAILAAFTTTAVVLPHSTAGVPLFLPDQIAIFGIGVVLAALALLPVRPRLEADAAGVRTRGLLGGYKQAPWTLVRAVEFRPGWRWARLILPADEVISLYAVQRWDGARSVHTMRALRALHAAALDVAALDVSGLDVSGLDAAGLDVSGLDVSGLDVSGLDVSGLDAAGLDVSGLDAAALDAAGLDAAALDASALDASALDASALDAAALDVSGLDPDPLAPGTRVAETLDPAEHRAPNS